MASAPSKRPSHRAAPVDEVTRPLGGSTSTLGCQPFPRRSRIVAGAALPVGVAFSEPRGAFHGLRSSFEQLCAMAVHLGDRQLPLRGRL
jgi:hypothetical protein